MPEAVLLVEVDGRGTARVGQGTSPCPDVVTANSGTASSTTGWITGFGFTA
jgi:hypothetical protein